MAIREQDWRHRKIRRLQVTRRETSQMSKQLSEGASREEEEDLEEEWLRQSTALSLSQE